MTEQGLLLINLGTPDSSDNKAVGRYLCQLLSDKRIITLPTWLRYCLLYGVVVPFRVQKSAKAYQAIWTKHGSPLLYHSQNLRDKLQQALGNTWQVVLGMRYGNPSLAKAVLQLHTCKQIIILPLYPQYAAATTGSSLAELFALFAQYTQIPKLDFIRDFYQQPSFIQVQAEQLKPYLAHTEYTLFSYHGLPATHTRTVGCQLICQHNCLVLNQDCYRSQCFHTTKLLADYLKLPQQSFATTFQSRLGGQKWLKPYTDQTLVKLRSRGILSLTIICPAFVTDCLETLEEIGIRAQAQWRQLGGTNLQLVPALNDNAAWVEAIMCILKSCKNN